MKEYISSVLVENIFLEKESASVEEEMVSCVSGVKVIDVVGEGEVAVEKEFAAFLLEVEMGFFVAF